MTAETYENALLKAIVSQQDNDFALWNNMHAKFNLENR